MKEFAVEIDSAGNAKTSDPDAPLTIETVRELQDMLAKVDAETCPECGNEVEDVNDHLANDCWIV